VVDLTGLFPTLDYSLRINNFWNVTYDYIAVDTTPQQNITIQKINPQAYLHQAFAAGETAASGNFTRYGDVTQLVFNTDDEFAIGRQGDAVSLQFPSNSLRAPAIGMVRDYFLYESCWFKDENGNWGFGFGFTADPLPFQNMTGFPYPPNENYPNDTTHQNYQQQWNTRTIQPQTPQNTTPNQGSLANSYLPSTLMIIFLSACLVYLAKVVDYFTIMASKNFPQSSWLRRKFEGQKKMPENNRNMSFQNFKSFLCDFHIII
jgi:hypothetical protein